MLGELTVFEFATSTVVIANDERLTVQWLLSATIHEHVQFQCFPVAESNQKRAKGYTKIRNGDLFSFSLAEIGLHRSRTPTAR